jgi:hypothetical protein
MIQSARRCPQAVRPLPDRRVARDQEGHRRLPEADGELARRRVVLFEGANHGLRTGRGGGGLVREDVRDDARRRRVGRPREQAGREGDERNPDNCRRQDRDCGPHALSAFR